MNHAALVRRWHSFVVGTQFAIVKSPRFWGSSMKFLNVIMGLVLAHGCCICQIDQAQADSLDVIGQSAKTTAARIHFSPLAIFSDPRGRPLNNVELSVTVREVLISDKSELQPVIAALALAMTGEKTAIGTGLGQAMMAVVSSDPSYANDIFYALATKADWIAIAAFVAVTGERMSERKIKDASAESAGAGDRSIGDGGRGDKVVGNGIRVAAATTAIAHGNTINPALPSSQPDTLPTAPEGGLTQNYSAAVVGPVDSLRPTMLAAHAEATKPAKSSQTTEVGGPAEPALPAEASKLGWTVPSREAANSAEMAWPMETARLIDITSPADAIRPTEASRPLEVAKPVETARTVEADRSSATTQGKTGETKWIVSETTSPVDYSPLIGATILPRQQVNSGLSGLTISCRAKRLALSLRLMGDLDVPRWGEIWIDSQIDDQRRGKQRWIWDEQQGKILFYEGDAAALLQSIPDGTTLRLGVGDSRGARHMATYQLFGLEAIRNKVATACTRPPSLAQAYSEKR
jgi:hypothetical protein